LPLQQATNGVKTTEVNGNTVGECLKCLRGKFPRIEEELFNEQGRLRSFIDIYVNGRSASSEGLAKLVKDGDELSIILIIGGG